MEMSKSLVNISLTDLNSEIECLLSKHDELTATRNEVIENV